MKNTIIFFFIATGLTAIILSVWFSEGKFIANGSEENFNIFYSQKNAREASSFWRSVGTGYKTSFLLPTYPTYAVLAGLETVAIPAFARQAALLATLMIVGMTGMYLLIRKGLNLDDTVAFIGGIFYLLNIYTMTQIWKRFIYAHMFAWGYLPLFTYLWIRWIDTRKKLWLLVFGASSLFFTFTFSNPVFLLTIWTPAIAFSLVKLWNERKNRIQFMSTIIASFIGLVLWLTVNIWWFLPNFTLGASWTTLTGQTWQSDLSSLHAVSKYFPIGEILLLRQSWYLGRENDWFNFYHHPFVYFISLLVLLITIWGVVKSKSFPYWKYLIVLAAVGLFVSKGTSSPFGYTFFEMLFSKFPISVALRNSYEKFGIVWLLPYAVFFAIGFNFLLHKFHKIKYLVGSMILLLSLGLLVYPMWTSDIFPQRQRLNVPDYYIETNNYLKSLPVVDNRIFTIPSSGELDRLTYSWGFYGVDPSDSLFEMEVLSIPKVPSFHPFYEILQKRLYKENVDKLLGLVGVENIILHKDEVGPKIKVSIWDIQTKIEEWNIASKKDFGQLTVYSLDKSMVKPRVWVARSIKSVPSMEVGVNDILNGSLDPSETVFILEDFGIVSDTQNFPKPQIGLHKHSPSRYTVNVKDAKGPYVLILNNTFDESWQLTVNSELIEPHFIANGFLNGWVVSKVGDYIAEIKLAVWPSLPF